MDVLCQHNASLFNAFRFPLFFMEDHVIFSDKFLGLYIFFLNLNQPANPRNYVPTNVPIFMNLRKLGPTKINDFTVYAYYSQDKKLLGTVWPDCKANAKT